MEYLGLDPHNPLDFPFSECDLCVFEFYCDRANITCYGDGF